MNAALAAVTFDSAQDFFGTTSVGVTIDDGLVGPQGTNPTGTVSITVNPVNDAPTVAATANNPAYAPGVGPVLRRDRLDGRERPVPSTQLVLTVTNVSGTDESLTIDGDTVALITAP